MATFEFDARSGRHGENARGWYHVDFGAYATFTGKVTCLDVSKGNWATLFGQITVGTGVADPTTYSPGQDPLYFVVVVHGKGGQKRAFPAPDEMSLTTWGTEAEFLEDPGIALADICGDPFTALGQDTMLKLVAGNISVRNR